MFWIKINKTNKLCASIYACGKIGRDFVDVFVLKSFTMFPENGAILPEIFHQKLWYLNSDDIHKFVGFSYKNLSDFRKHNNTASIMLP